MAKYIRIGAFVSGTGTNLQAIIKACKIGKIEGEVVFVGSDRPGVKGLRKAIKKKIPTFTVNYKRIIEQCKRNFSKIIPPKDFDFLEILRKQNLFPRGSDIGEVYLFLVTRAMAEAKLLEKMKSFPFDLLVLAGFMRNVTPYFIDRVNINPDEPKIMNIHPALLPSFPGTDGYGDTFKYGCKVGGCTVHFVDYGEDTGRVHARGAGG